VHRTLIAVALGGVVGTGIRLALDLAIPHRIDEFPTSTLIINVIGAFALGLLAGWLWRRGIPEWLKAGLGAGLLGSFTTFSAIAAATVGLTMAGDGGAAILNLAFTVVLGLGAAWLGLVAGGRIPPRHVADESWADD
jgi:CrcB protein